MIQQKKIKILILGGGFGGIYTALELEKRLKRRPEVELTLVNRDNFFLFTPMLHEVAASDLDPTDIVNPIRKLVSRVQFFDGSVESIDLNAKQVHVFHGDGNHEHDLSYDHLVIGLGSVPNFFRIPGVEERCITMKSLDDAVALRNRLIEHLEEANFECCSELRERLLTFVVAGAGFAGVETIAAANDFVRDVIRFYPNLRDDMVRFVLVDYAPGILPELDAKLGTYAQQKLAQRGIEIRLKTAVNGMTDSGVELSDGTFIETNTLIWTAGTSPNALLATLPCRKDKGKLIADPSTATPLTLDGSYILHQMFRIRRAAWRGVVAAAQKHLLTRAATLFTAMEQNKREATGLFSMLGHKGDLMLVHFRKSLDALNDAELTVAQSELYEYLDPSASYLSVVELGLYGASLKLYSELTAKGVAPRTGEWNREVEAELSKQRDAAAPRLWPEIPQRRYLCFYPMNKFRGETKNWYSQPIHERRRMMREHGTIGRHYASRVIQIISGSIGFDDWEWGVDLFADDPLVFKKLVYEMRFDEASAVYGQFGTFFVGLRFPPDQLETFFGGKTPSYS